MGGIEGIGRPAVFFPDAAYIRRDLKLNPGTRFTYEIWKEQ